MKRKSAGISRAALPYQVKVNSVEEIQFPFQFCSHFSPNSFGFMFIFKENMKTVCCVTPVNETKTLFPLTTGSALKPFALLIPTLSRENRLREKFPAWCICIFARLAVSREVNRATQSFKHFSGTKRWHLRCPWLCFILRWWKSEKDFHSRWAESTEVCFRCPWSICLKTYLPWTYSPLELSFLNSNCSLIPPFRVHLTTRFSSYPSVLMLTVIVCLNVCLYYCCFQVMLPPPCTLCSISIYCFTPLPVWERLHALLQSVISLFQFYLLKRLERQCIKDTI